MLRTFIEIAQEQGVDGLLSNPLSLDMLAKAVPSGRGWPESRKETFEMACRKIVDEHHPSHKEAQASKGYPSSDQLLDAAGRLCAVQLISGVAGYTLRGEPDEDYPALDQCDSDSLEMLRYALATKLFKSVSDNRFSPIHRHIAEFLGAQHLAKVIKSGLPARRVIALIVGEDGTVVTEMRGLSAWLAAHCQDARANLIERDPIGVGLYGDIREFFPEEKRTLLESLNREASRLDSMWSITAAFGALATPDMESEIEAILSDSNHDRDHQMFIGFLLDVLREGGPLPNLSGLLLEIVRDDTRRSRINILALNAFRHNCLDSQDKTSKLKALLADIRGERVSDPNNELLGILLSQLYPQELPPSEVWDYLLADARTKQLRYQIFWNRELLERSTDEQVAELLDSLQKWLPDLRPVLNSYLFSKLPASLLRCGLEVYGDKIETERLYNWLSVGLGQQVSQHDAESVDYIRSWLEQRPEVQKAVFLEGLFRCPESDEFKFRRRAFKVLERWYGAGPPPDFGFWCLEQAVAIADARPQAAEYLLVKAYWSDNGPSLELLREYTQKNKRLNACLDQLLDSRSRIEQEELEYQEQKKTLIEERQQQEEQWLEYARSNEIALRENRAAPELLYNMAEVYFDKSQDIAKLLRGDQSLIDAALQGLRGVIDREDVPDVEEILSLREKSRRHYLGWPFLAGLAEIEGIAPEEAPSQWDDSRIRKAIAFYYCTPPMDYRPEWYQRLLKVRPEIVAEVQVQFAISGFRSGRENIYKFYQLAHDPSLARVAKYASLPLLRAFPTRCKLTQVKDLDQLLWTAIQHADRVSLQELIETKLSRKSMNDAQRVYWLSAGIIVSPRTYSDLLRNFVQGREEPTRHVMAFFENRIQFSSDILGIPFLEFLIRLFGSYAGPGQLWSGNSERGYVGPEMRASELVHDLIQRLAAFPTKDASDSLDRLLADPALSRWRDVLSQAQDAQRMIRRDASYRHLDIEQVCQTLNGGTPANAADLAALVMDRLDEIARKIRGGSTSDWCQYWNVDQYDRPICEKPENACRNNLLSDLQNRLEQLDIDAQPEGQYANEKRSDIRVYFGGSNVPVEIKKNSHQKLWSSLRDQLIANYTSTPGTDGYGIYLVFWFGKEHTQASEEGRPANPEELKKQLEATLSPDEARKISVCVIDVSRPD